MMFARFCKVTSLSVIAFVFLSLPAAVAQVQGADCSQLVAGHSFANTFEGFMNTQKFAGFTLGDQPIWGLLPNAGAGVTTFYPGGIVKNSESLVVGQFGVFPGVDVTGTYSLKWDTTRFPILCTGTAHMTGNAGVVPMVDDFQISVTPDGKRLQMIHTNPGLIVQTTTRPAESRRCRNSTVAGEYTYSTTGWALGQLEPSAGPAQELAGYITAAMTGGMQFYPGLAAPDGFENVPDGASAVLAWDTLGIDGGVPAGNTFVPVQRKEWGWYYVDPKTCAGTMVLRDDTGMDPDFQINFYMGKDGNAIYAVNVNNLADLAPGAPRVPVFVMPIPLLRVNAQEGR
jgi:hypothetical protein